MTRSLSTTLPDSSRNRSGRNCCGCCQSSGSMCAQYRLTSTCVSNRVCTNHNIITIRLAIYGGHGFVYAGHPTTVIFLSQRLNTISNLCSYAPIRQCVRVGYTQPQSSHPVTHITNNIVPERSCSSSGFPACAAYTRKTFTNLSSKTNFTIMTRSLRLSTLTTLFTHFSA